MQETIRKAFAIEAVNPLALCRVTANSRTCAHGKLDAAARPPDALARNCVGPLPRLTSGARYDLMGLGCLLVSVLFRGVPGSAFPARLRSVRQFSYPFHGGT